MNIKHEVIEHIDKVTVCSLEEIKQYMRISHSNDDELLLMLQEAAIEAAQNQTGKHIHNLRVIASIFKSNLTIVLNHQPVIEIVAIEEIGHNQHIDITEEFSIDQLNPSEFISVPMRYTDKNLKITYAAGFGENVPVTLKSGILRHIALLYEAPESIAICKEIMDIYHPYRKLKI